MTTKLLVLAPLLALCAACAPTFSASTAPLAPSGTSSTSVPTPTQAGSAPLTAPASTSPSQYTLRAINTGLSSNTLAGTATLSQVGTSATTTLRVTGLQPVTNYIASYRVGGNIPSVTPCSQPGNPVSGSSFTGKSDNSGALTLTSTVPNSTLIPAVTLVLSTADLAGDEAIDGGILCTSVMPLHR